MKTIIIYTTLTALMIGSCWSAALSAELTIPVSGAQVIANPTNSAETMILLSFDMPEALSGAEVYDAELVIKPSLNYSGRNFADLLVYPLAEQLAVGSANWSYIHANAEELLDLGNGCHEIIDSENDGLIHVNLTHWFTAYGVGDVSNFGLLLVPSSTDDMDLALSEDNSFPQGAKGIIRVIYARRQ